MRCVGLSCKICNKALSYYEETEFEYKTHNYQKYKILSNHHKKEHGGNPSKYKLRVKIYTELLFVSIFYLLKRLLYYATLIPWMIHEKII